MDFNAAHESAEAGDLKLYLGGLPLQCTDDDLVQYFSKYGEVLEVNINRNKNGTPKGCGDVLFTTTNIEMSAQKILKNKHYLLGQFIDVKRFVSCQTERMNTI